MNTTTFLCVVVPVLVLVAIVVIRGRIEAQAAAELEQARQAYQSALARLKKNPTSADEKQHTLEVGRGYANMTRQRKGVTIFDEMALMNDINAATAGASAAPAAAAPAATSVEDRLKRLDELRNKGVISDQEWQERREKILGEL